MATSMAPPAASLRQSSSRGSSSAHDALTPPPTTSPRLRLALRPSVSLGPFKLGLSLWHTIDYLRSHASLFPHVNITYSQNSPRLSPILVTIEPHLNLVFSGTTQRLTIITLDRLDPASNKLQQDDDPAHRAVDVNYNGRVIHSTAQGHDSATLTRSALHQLLGPTYPGWTQGRADAYPGEAAGQRKQQQNDVQEFVLGYPGVAFAFLKQQRQAIGKDGDVDKHQPVATLYVFSGSDPAKPAEVILAPSSLGASSSTTGSPSHPPRAAPSPIFADSLLEADRAALDPDAISVRTPCLLEAVVEPHRGVTLHFARNPGGGGGGSSGSGGSGGSRTASPLPPPTAKGRSSTSAGSERTTVAVSDAGATTATTSVELLLGVTTPQDAMCDLGTPQRVFYKEDDRMRIHADAAGQETGTGQAGRSRTGETDAGAGRGQDAWTEQATPFFFNYFDLGLDLLFSTSAGVASSDAAAHAGVTTGQATLEKVVCHTNVPGDALFARYNRCPWRVVARGGGDRSGAGEGGMDYKMAWHLESQLPSSSSAAGGGGGGVGGKARKEAGRMELDRATSIEFLGGAAAYDEGLSEGGGGTITRPLLAPHASAEGGAGQAKREEARTSSSSKIRIDLATHLVAPRGEEGGEGEGEGEGLVAEVGREGSVVGLVVF